jgi:hypothetical protein
VLHILEETLLAPLAVIIGRIFDTVISKNSILLEAFVKCKCLFQEPG